VVKGEDRVKGGEMTQTLYVHMNKKKSTLLYLPNFMFLMSQFLPL
jgi:hypothetical protein